MIVDIFFTALAVGMLGRAIHRYRNEVDDVWVVVLWAFLTAANCATWIF